MEKAASRLLTMAMSEEHDTTTLGALRFYLGTQHPGFRAPAMITAQAKESGAAEDAAIVYLPHIHRFNGSMAPPAESTEGQAAEDTDDDIIESSFEPGEVAAMMRDSSCREMEQAEMKLEAEQGLLFI